MWKAPITETPRVGSTEEWVIANLTADSHPIHLHLVQFQLLSRQDFDADGYMKKWEEVNGTGNPIKPDDNEIMRPYQVKKQFEASY